jgi:hypothetical protein
LSKCDWTKIRFARRIRFNRELARLLQDIVEI